MQRIVTVPCHSDGVILVAAATADTTSAFEVLAAVGTFLSAVAALLLVLLTRRQLRSLEAQVKHSGDQVEAAQCALAAAERSAEAAQHAVREAARQRADDAAPRVIVLMEEPECPPFVDRHRSRMPGADELRLLHPRSLGQSKVATDAQPFTFDRDRSHFMWFRGRGVLINEGQGTARVRLPGESRFLQGSSPLTHDQELQPPPQLGPAQDGQYLLRPGETALFEWGYGHTLGEWADAWENPMPPNPHGACFLNLAAADSFEHGVIDQMYVVVSARPIEPVPGALGQWRLIEDVDRTIGMTIYPIQRTYREEGRGLPPPPWQETYAAWNEQQQTGS
jgi:hypothetical protein